MNGFLVIVEVFKSRNYDSQGESPRTSVALDTVDHEILLEQLQISFGVTGAFLCWLRSFLRERSFCVVHESTRSPWVPAPYGNPQGSVLGSLLYLIYISDLATLLASYSALAQLYADDIQAYLHCSASDAIATTQVMTFIMGAFGAWISSNRLRLNSAKTQFICMAGHPPTTGSF